MFTGIITDIGTVLRNEWLGDTHIVVATGYDIATIAIGESIACSGCCLTVVETGCSDGLNWFSATLSQETVSRTASGMWEIGVKLNLERSLRMGDALSGHFVSGHVDGVASIENMEVRGESYSVTLSAPPALMRYIVPKGSVALNGVSLTVNEVIADRFTVNLIPHSWNCTTFKLSKAGDVVNVEIDMLARYALSSLEPR